MTIERKYMCNFCHGSDEAKLIGIHWTGNSAGQFEEALKQGYRSVENHLCRPCIRSIAAIAATLSPGYDS